MHFYSDAVPALLAEHLGRSRPGTFMDLGCGDGNLLQALQARGMLEGVNVWAVDLSEERVAAVREACPAFHCLVASACDLPDVPDESVDFLVSTQVIEHVPDDAQMVREIRRVTRPGGTVYLSTVFKKPWAWYFRRCNGRWALDPTHVREYRRNQELLDPTRDAGMEVLESRKTLISFPLIDPLLRLLRVPRRVFLRSRLLRGLRRIKLPILGYYNWELVLRSTPAAPTDSELPSDE